MVKKNIDVKLGYDLWSEDYDVTDNPVVWIDGWALTQRLRVLPGERVLDAGCGTGRNFARLMEQGADLTGVDFSAGMLSVAHQKHPDITLVQADMQQDWPFDSGRFDLVVCALVGEHLGELDHVFSEVHRVLTTGGRFIYSVYHPQMAAAGKEARFIRGETEFRLGAFKHELDDYLRSIEDAGFAITSCEELVGPPELGQELPSKMHYVGYPLLVIIEATRTAEP